MRTEQQMFDLILETARMDERIRAVILNGSRANPNARRDMLQDFDIVYVVTEINSFLRDPHWIDRFGERMVMQLPDQMDTPDRVKWDHFAYLMQFTDGNRIDLTLVTPDFFANSERDSLTILLLDKDGVIPAFPPPDESSYLPKPPSSLDFFNCCNEFWWVCPYVAKGLWRREILYAKYMHDEVVREQLMKMLTWYIGIKTGFKINPGKSGKYFKQYLEPDLWDLLQQTYSTADYDATWAALVNTCKLFRNVAQCVANHFSFEYLDQDDQRVTAHIQFMRSLPTDAQEMY